MSDTAPMGRVLHWVGPLSADGTRQSLWPTVLALAGSGVAQCVVLSHDDDTAEARLMLPRSVRIVSPPAARRWGRPWARHPAAAPEGLLALLTEQPVLALHLHGAAVLGSGLKALRRLAVPAPVFIHTGTGVPLRQRLRWARLPPLHGLQAYRVQGGQVQAVRTLQQRLPTAPAGPLNEALLGLARAEAARPRIVTLGRPDDLALARHCAQLAVLFTGAEPALTFAWIGAANAAVLAVLQAAQIELVPAHHGHDRAAALRTAWLYLAPQGNAADAPGLVEAMSAALPCVVRDQPACRALVVDRLSGWVCDTPADFLGAIAQLVDARPLRHAIGQAARQRSVQRYGRDHFRASLLVAHGLTLPVDETPPLTGPDDPPA